MKKTIKEELICLLEIRNKHLILEYATKQYQNKDVKLMSGRLKENSWLLNKLKKDNLNNIINYLESKVKHIKKMKAYIRRFIQSNKNKNGLIV